jgi:hypothetical protein
VLVEQRQQVEDASGRSMASSVADAAPRAPPKESGNAMSTSRSRSLRAVAVIWVCVLATLPLAGCAGVPRQVTPNYEAVIQPALEQVLRAAGQALTRRTSRRPSSISDGEVAAAMDAALRSGRPADGGALTVTALTIARSGRVLSVDVQVTDPASKGSWHGCLRLPGEGKYDVRITPCL